LLDRLIVRIGRYRTELGLALQYDVRAAARSTDVQAGPRVAPQVLGLRPVVGERDDDPPPRVVVHIGHVRQLRPAVALEGDKDTEAVAADPVREGFTHAVQARNSSALERK
jgi:hypothetical protein